MAIHVSARTRRAAWILAPFLLAARPLAAQLPAPPVTADGPLRLGGYASVVFERPEHPESVERLSVGELSAAVLGWGRLGSRASYLAEIDVANRTNDTWTGRETDRRFDVARLYLEYTVSELLRLRVGRFLTPVGQWNEDHAEPLTWTPMRPLATYRPFAKSLTGVMASGEMPVAGRETGYALFFAPPGLSDQGREESSFVRAFGARVATELTPGLWIGASAAALRRSHPEYREGSGGGEGGARTASPVRRTPTGEASWAWTCATGASGWRCRRRRLCFPGGTNRLPRAEASSSPR